MLTLLKIAGGVALLLLGVRYLRKGLDRLFGPRLGTWMHRIGAKKGWAFITGILVSIVAPSSTTMSLLAVQTLQAGHMTTRQMLAVMLGANIGITVLVQLVALHVEEFGPVLIFFGVLLFQYSSANKSRGIGQLLLAIGLFFLAVFLIKYTVQNMSATGPSSDLGRIIDIAQKYPFWITALAAALAMLLQSATATIGLVIGLGAADVVGLETAVPVVIGANVGLGVTTLMVGWRQIDSRRLGAAVLLLKVVVALIGLLVMSWIIQWSSQMPGGLPARVANLHTGFNVTCAVIGLPLAGVLTRLAERIIPAPPEGSRRAFGPKFIHRGPVDSIALAQGQSLREILHMSEIVRSMLHDVWTALKTGNERLAHEVSMRDDKVDLLDTEIKRFLTRLVKEETDRHDAEEQIRQLQYLTELETVGDIIDKNLSELVIKKIRNAAEFSDEGARDLDEFYSRVVENLMIADAAFTTRDRKLAEQLLRHKEWLNELDQDLRDRHYARLNAGLSQSLDSSAIHLDLLTHLKRINSCVTHVAHPILQNGRNSHADRHAAPPVE